MVTTNLLILELFTIDYGLNFYQMRSLHSLNMTTKQFVKAPETLRANFASGPQSKRPSRVWMYCGSLLSCLSKVVKRGPEPKDLFCTCWSELVFSWGIPANFNVHQSKEWVFNYNIIVREQRTHCCHRRDVMWRMTMKRIHVLLQTTKLLCLKDCHVVQLSAYRPCDLSMCVSTLPVGIFTLVNISRGNEWQRPVLCLPLACFRWLHYVLYCTRLSFAMKNSLYVHQRNLQ